MPKKESYLKRIKDIHLQNPAIAFSFLWVLVVPTLGSSLLLKGLYTNGLDWNKYDLYAPEIIIGLTLTGALLMGLAITPTTILAIATGFLWGWKAFLPLVIAYAMASLMGYFLGKRLGQNSLEIILSNYPKADRLIQDKKGKWGKLIFYIRISPVIPFALSNLLFALLKTGWKNVLVYGTLGMLPRTLMAFTLGTYAESFIQAFEGQENNGQILILISLMILSLWGIFRFFKKKSPTKKVKG
ncbi:VTT domain-containing protein [Echinicola jeungdonensis]|uniref:TVP38/TMEM64 family membrane protein n=1 Tax=Echinicola jeungdonensis TaxID=709343 RepID=A0ABV5J7K3_9BACT|nr:VTT domain-containing protein [Echinicola jeungdonensis]MDN3669732.1 VTT domain-containing protein [Echinicola jeungdonensis]